MTHATQRIPAKVIHQNENNVGARRLGGVSGEAGSSKQRNRDGNEAKDVFHELERDAKQLPDVTRNYPAGTAAEKGDLEKSPIKFLWLSPCLKSYLGLKNRCDTASEEGDSASEILRGGVFPA